MRVACWLAVLGVVAALALTHAAWLAALGLNVRDLPGLMNQLRRNEAEGERYAEVRARVADLTRCKDEAARDLSAGRLTLAEAVDRVRRAGAPDSPQLLRHLRREHPAATEDEVWRRHLIYWVGRVLQDEPERRDAVLARLEAELGAARAP